MNDEQQKILCKRKQLTMCYDAEHNITEKDLLFLDFVKDGLTRKELEKNIERRPELWGRYSNWLDKLPKE